MVKNTITFYMRLFISKNNKNSKKKKAKNKTAIKYFVHSRV